jgi:anaerobic selenocysteine-containing dehydrogenase
MITTVPSFCRACLTCCPVLVDVEDGRLLAVHGDRSNPVFEGYTCIKGRAEPSVYNHPDRLLWSQERQADGTHAPIAADVAMDRVAEQIGRVLDRWGPAAVAGYFGTKVLANWAAVPVLSAFMEAIGSPMIFTPNTIDKPGKPIARALLGSWMAPLQQYDDAEVALLFGLNPFVTYYGMACGNPSKWYRERVRAGMKVIVVDPRRSDIARRADLFLQPLPGHDPEILAALINVILAENLHDERFVAQEVEGVDALRRAVAPFTPQMVAARADLRADDLVLAARMFAGARRGYAASGVGPSMSSSSTLVEYLVLVLETLCGHWLRAGERIARTTTLFEAPPARAQAAGPRPAFGFGHQLRVHGLADTAAGMPTGVLADEMLMEGEGQVRVLLSLGGNPVGAWPDQIKVVDAVRELDLLVQFDPWMTPTARMAHYVIAPKMAYEVPGATTMLDSVILMGTYYGPAEAYAHYTDAVVDTPPGSDLVEEWQFLSGVAQRLGLKLRLRDPIMGTEFPVTVDPTVALTTNDLLGLLAARGRIPFDDVKRHPHGAEFRDPPVYVAPKEEGCTARLDVANDHMMSDLAGMAEVGMGETSSGRHDDGYPFRLLGRRVAHMYNTSKPVERVRPYNPAFMHPEDLEALGLFDGDEVVIESHRGAIPAVVAADDNLRRGVVSMTHGYGATPDRDDEFRTIGSPTSRLVDGSDFADRYVGMPRMSNIPVRVTARSTTTVRG